MIIILQPDTPDTDPEYQRLLRYLGGFANIELRTHKEIGAHQVLTEIYLVGDTLSLNAKEIEAFVVVERVIRVSREYRILGRHTDDVRSAFFEYNGDNCGRRSHQRYYAPSQAVWR